MNSSGGTNAPFSSCQRTSASAPTRAPSRSRWIGCQCSENASAASASRSRMVSESRSTGRSAFGSYSSARPRPDIFALVIALSARRSTCSALIGSPSTTQTPTLGCICSSCSPSRTPSASRSSTRRAQSAAPAIGSSAGRSPSTIANSSPTSRPTASGGPIAVASRRAASLISASPSSYPRLSLMSLSWPSSTCRTPTGCAGEARASRRSTSSSSQRRVGSPVSGSNRVEWASAAARAANTSRAEYVTWSPSQSTTDSDIALACGPDSSALTASARARSAASGGGSPAGSAGSAGASDPTRSPRLRRVRPVASWSTAARSATSNIRSCTRSPPLLALRQHPRSSSTRQLIQSKFTWIEPH